ncbi:serine hydrolase [Dermatophilaceae bacterium Sec6.4]
MKRSEFLIGAGLSVAAAAVTGSASATEPASQPAAGKPRPLPVDTRIRVTSPPNPGTAVVESPAGGVSEALRMLPWLTGSTLIASRVPGLAIAVVHQGKTVFAQGYGVRQIGKPGRVDTRTVFQLASLSKPIGATVVARQVSRSQVKWDTPVTALLPHFALADPWVTSHLTIGDCYAHRSGLPPAAGDLLEDIGYGRDYVLHHLRDEPLAPFRSSYAYANFGLTIGAEAVARAAGIDWDTLSQQQLYGPLGMTSTSSRYRDFIARTNRAAMHAKVGKRFLPLYQRDADPQSPAGGVSSNVIDMAAWMKMVLAQGKIGHNQWIETTALLPAISAEMIQHPANDVLARPGQYGYGFNVGVQPGGRVTMGHSGAFAQGVGTAFTMIPSADIGIVVLTNGSPVGAAESLIASFLDIVQFGYLTRDWWKTYQPALAGLMDPVGDLVGVKPPKHPAPSAPTNALVGTYRNHYYGTAVVRRHGGILTMELGPRHRYTFTLNHWDGSTFSFIPTGENAPAGSLSSAKFVVSHGKASAVTLQFFDAQKHGTWTR